MTTDSVKSVAETFSHVAVGAKIKSYDRFA